MTKWEYRTVTVETEEAKTFIDSLNILGGEGWELVSTFTIENITSRFLVSGTETSGIVAVLKRPKE